jgi:hypothetical protein
MGHGRIGGTTIGFQPMMHAWIKVREELMQYDEFIERVQAVG